MSDPGDQAWFMSDEEWAESDPDFQKTPTGLNEEAPASSDEDSKVAALARCSTGGPSNLNALKADQPEPIVDPPVRVIAQFYADWAKKPLHHAKGTQLWGPAGCHPSSLASLLRWWSEDNAATTGKLQFPNALSDLNKTKIDDPRDVCYLFNGSEYVENKHLCKMSDQVKTEAGKALKFEITWPGAGNVNRKTKMIKKYLQYGPILVEMRYPAHFVMITGFRDKTIYICDPGNVLYNHDNWGKKAGKEVKGGVRKPTGKLLDSEKDRRCYVSLESDHTFSGVTWEADEKDANGDKVKVTKTENLKWLQTIDIIERVYFDDDKHAEWNQTPKP